MDVLSKAKTWLESSKVDAQTKAEIKAMMKADDNTRLVDSFYKDLEFGTGGLRGIMGVGSNRINQYTVGMATQGLANYLKETFPDEKIKVAVAYDSRNNSRFFAEQTAKVFAGNDIEVYLFDGLRPTPELSFAIRTMECHGGVVITASHNPKEYNGYKAYWDDGAQLIPPHDKNVMDEVKAIASIDSIRSTDDGSLVHGIGREIDKQYLAMIAGLSLSPEAIAQHHDLKIVFSPIHGTGIKLVPDILKMLGFTQVIIIEEQSEPNGDFPTVVYPNPEEAEALKMALTQAEAVGADLVMATDPDADRVGIAVRNTKGELQLLNGNQIGSLLIYYLLNRWKATGKMTGNRYVVKTIVTTDLIADIADDYGVKSYETLTGFKYIAELIRRLEGREQFIGGGEESYGYLIGDQVRDKDAIAGCAIIAEMAAWAKSEGNSLFELLMHISQQYGLYKEGLKSVTKKGKTGAEEIKSMMEQFRSNPPDTLGGERVLSCLDYSTGIRKHLTSGEETAINLPKSNVLQFVTEKGSKISIRPSGTEPKIKFYFSVKDSSILKILDFYEASERLQQTIDRMNLELAG